MPRITQILFGTIHRYLALLVHYCYSSAIIARSGGILSHGSPLLSELQIPFAILPEIPSEWLGKRVCLNNGQLSLIE
jgi:hypothetical protein